MCKKIIIPIVTIVAVLGILLTIILTIPKDSNDNDRPQSNIQQPSGTYEDIPVNTEQIHTTDKIGDIIVSENEYGGKNYILTVPTRK